MRMIISQDTLPFFRTRECPLDYHTLYMPNFFISKSSEVIILNK